MYVGSHVWDVQVMLRGVELTSGILRNLVVLKKERDCLRYEQPFLPLVTHGVGLCLCHLFLAELNAECSLFGSEGASWALPKTPSCLVGCASGVMATESESPQTDKTSLSPLKMMLIR